jgi:hypothetical protein
MAVKQTRKLVLRKGRKSLELELGQGHVWEIFDGGSNGYPLYDAKEEIAQFDSLLKAWQAKGYAVVTDTGLIVKAGPKKPPGMDAATWRWIKEADPILGMWRDDDYDNHKDAILDARSMLEKSPKDQPARVQRLERMLAKAMKELAQLAKEEPAIAEYAEGLLLPPPAKRKPKPAKRKPKPAKRKPKPAKRKPKRAK